MKNFFNENMRLFLGVIIGALASSITAYAVTSYSSNQVRYTSDRSVLAVNDVNSALDELYLSTTLGVPTGTILPLMRTNAPSGYLKCDGAVYNIADYKNLADAIKADFGSYNYFGGNGTTTFAVPNLQGEFLRGTGTNGHTNQGNGANVGVHQDGTLVDTSTTAESWSTSNIGHIVSGTDIKSSRNADGIVKTGVAYNFNKTSSARTTSNNSLMLVKPTNTSVLYVIKY